MRRRLFISWPAWALAAAFMFLQPRQAVLAVQPLGDEPQPTWQSYFHLLASEYRITAGPERRELALVKQPVLKWTQPVRGGQDGAVFLWLDGERPAVIGTFFIWPAGEDRQGVSHELHRLAADRIAGDWRGRIEWRPAKDDVAWQSIPGAPQPQADKSKRAFQSRQLARRFAAASRTRAGEVNELRLQPRPFFEYEAKSADSPWLGGALFSLAHGTDTEVVLWLEARRGDDSDGQDGGAGWRFSLARMSDLELLPRLDEKPLTIGQFAGYDKFDSPYLCTSPETFKEPPAAASAAAK